MWPVESYVKEEGYGLITLRAKVWFYFVYLNNYIKVTADTLTVKQSMPQVKTKKVQKQITYDYRIHNVKTYSALRTKLKM